MFNMNKMLFYCFNPSSTTDAVIMNKDGVEEASSPSISDMYKTSSNKEETDRAISPLVEEARIYPGGNSDQTEIMYKSSFIKQVILFFPNYYYSFIFFFLAVLF